MQNGKCKAPGPVILVSNHLVPREGCGVSSPEGLHGHLNESAAPRMLGGYGSKSCRVSGSPKGSGVAPSEQSSGTQPQPHMWCHVKCH